MEVNGAHSSKYLLLHPAKERKSFRITLGCVNDEKALIVTRESLKKVLCKIKNV